MTHKRMLFASALFFMFLPGALAQSPDGQQSDRPPQAQLRQQQQRRLALLAQRLNLTDDQKRQWLQIQKETGQQVRLTRKDDSLNEQQMQARLKEIHKQQKERIMALLSPEQQQALKDFWEEQKQKQQGDKTSDNGSSSDPSAQSKENDKQDDLFAGMVSDDPVPPPPPAQSKKAK